jgi:hypothetical protein
LTSQSRLAFGTAFEVLPEAHCHAAVSHEQWLVLIKAKSIAYSHLLGKKSWNVYNPENIAKVRRDEADARAKAAEEERSQKATESNSRLELLRGHGSAVEGDDRTLNTSDEAQPSKRRRHSSPHDYRDRAVSEQRGREHSVQKHSNHDGRPVFDHNGHIDLFKDPERRQIVREKKDIGRVEEGMRLVDAAGYNSRASDPWYRSSAADVGHETSKTTTDVWGNEDPLRQQREVQRIAANDPLAAMKRGVRQVKQAEAERKQWMAQRERDLHEVEDLGRRHRKHHRHRHRRRDNGDSDSLDDFRLDDAAEGRSRRRSPARRERREGEKEHRLHRDHKTRSRDERSHRHRQRSRSPQRR